MFLTGQAEIDKAVAKLNNAVSTLPEGSAGDLLVLPLYAALPPELQLRVFRPAAPGVRRCIIATNVAETSITGVGVLGTWPTARGVVHVACKGAVASARTCTCTCTHTGVWLIRVAACCCWLQWRAWCMLSTLA